MVHMSVIMESHTYMSVLLWSPRCKNVIQYGAQCSTCPPFVTSGWLLQAVVIRLYSDGIVPALMVIMLVVASPLFYCEVTLLREFVLGMSQALGWQHLVEWVLTAFGGVGTDSIVGVAGVTCGCMGSGRLCSRLTGVACGCGNIVGASGSSVDGTCWHTSKLGLQCLGGDNMLGSLLGVYSSWG